MSKYKIYYYLTISSIILISMGLLFGIIYPIWLYYQLPSSPVRLKIMGDNLSQSSINWIENYLKLDQSSGNDSGNIMVFNNKDAFTDTNIQKIPGNFAIFEQLYSQISESKTDLDKLNYLSGVTYSGYFGATYEDLSDQSNIPEKLIQLYQKNTGGAWNYFGEGIILSDNENVFVLRRGVEYAGSLHLQIENQIIDYSGIFEITGTTAPVEGRFSIDLLSEGEKIFSAAGLPAVFPAMIKIERNLYDAYYIAGNFSNYQVNLPFKYERIAGLMKSKLLYDRFSNEEVFWRWYYPTLEKLVSIAATKIEQNKPLVEVKQPDKPVSFYISGQTIYMKDSSSTARFFVKGVNLGPALPGRYFTEPPEDKDSYLGWFNQIAKLNVNTIRIYTLLPPAFYQALYEFNLDNPTPLYLLQEIWPEEYPIDSNYLNPDYNQTYHQEIEYAIHAVHGNIQIPERSSRSYGLYAYDISPYLLGYLVGREMEPDEVLATDTLNKGYRFTGDYFYSLPQATPTESWLAASCDYALSLENSDYASQPMIAIVSWPTLDPLTHNSEWNSSGDKSKQYNDKAIVNINNIGITQNKMVSFFGAYHIYPNYPDFMNNDVAYANYRDEQGVFRYGGYLQAFIQQHSKYPAIVAEYGLSSSSVTAHFNPDGYNHGGMNEIQQANGIIRMTNAIKKEGYAGAIIFEWMDEWVKKTWTTEYYMIPYDRHVLWHNVLDPEQNYGLLAYEASTPFWQNVYSSPDKNDEIVSVNVGQNAEYLEIQMTGSEQFDSLQPLSIAINTYDEAGQTEPVWEYLLLLGDKPQLLINPAYNWLKGKYASSPADFSEFEIMEQLTNSSNLTKEGIYSPEKAQNLSELKVGAFKNNENQVFYGNHTIGIRIPYGLLAISDPSSHTVLFDKRVFTPDAQDQIKTTQSNKISLRIMLKNDKVIDINYNLTAWEIPQYTQRLKDGFEILSNYFAR